MYCDKCGSYNPDGSGFCGNCGSPLKKEPPQGPAVERDYSPNENRHLNVPKPPKRRHSKKETASAFALVVALLVTAMVFFYLFHQNPMHYEKLTHPTLEETPRGTHPQSAQQPSLAETACTTEEPPATLPEFTESAKEIPSYFGENNMWYEFLMHYDFLAFTPGWNDAPHGKEYWSYWIQDINNDGLSELFLHTPERDSGYYHIWIFTMQDSVPYLVHHRTTTYRAFYSSEDNAVCLHRPYPVDGWLSSQFYKLEETELCLLFEILQSEGEKSQQAYLLRDGKKEPVSYDIYKSPHGPSEHEHIAEWTRLVPDITFPEAEELSGYLGTDIHKFKNKFPNMNSVGSYGINYTNGTIGCSAFLDNSGQAPINNISIDFPGEPYSILGIQAGMDIAEAEKIITGQGGVKGDTGSGYSDYNLPNSTRLHLNIYDRLDKVIVKSITLADK